jgi:hypothetical protein
MKLIMENWRHFKQGLDEIYVTSGEEAIRGDIESAQQQAAAEPSDAPIVLNTLGDLKATLSRAIRAKKVGNMKDRSIDVIKGVTIGPAMDMWGLMKAAYKLPDDADVGPGLDSLNVDDDVSAIVDDKLENAFLNTLHKELNSQTLDDSTLLAQMDMTKMLSNFIASRHDKRTVVKPENTS